MDIGGSEGGESGGGELGTGVFLQEGEERGEIVLVGAGGVRAVAFNFGEPLQETALAIRGKCQR